MVKKDDNEKEFNRKGKRSFKSENLPKMTRSTLMTNKIVKEKRRLWHQSSKE